MYISKKTNKYIYMYIYIYIYIYTYICIYIYIYIYIFNKVIKMAIAFRQHAGFGPSSSPQSHCGNGENGRIGLSS